MQDQIIDANKQELYGLSSENLHLKTRILNLEETILSLNKLSIKKACTEKSNRNECSVTENDDRSYNNLSFDAPVQAGKQNKAISKIMVQNENLIIDKLNTGNNSAPEISEQSQQQK